MSSCLSQHTIRAITGYVLPGAQERKLAELGYIVLGRNAKNEVMALETHPRDPAVTAGKDRGEVATLNI